MSARQKYIDLIYEWKLRKTDIAGIANVIPARISDYTQDKPLLPGKCKRIEKAIVESVEVLAAFHPLRVDISDPESFSLALQMVREHGARISAEQLEAMLSQANSVFELSVSGK